MLLLNYNIHSYLIWLWTFNVFNINKVYTLFQLKHRHTAQFAILTFSILTPHKVPSKKNLERDNWIQFYTGYNAVLLPS